MNVPIEVYDLLERRLGREDAMAVAKSIEASLTLIEQRSREIAQSRKQEVKEELKRELRDELSTKEDLAKLEGSIREEMARLEGRMEARFERLDKKFTVLFMTTIFVVIFLNQEALSFLAGLLGLVR
ncbi:MAG: hypothetical protein NZ524_00320 [Thiobacillaceae bacterium]|nr:hypothetical protein [Thiobacillaceae bacterium]MCX7673961.1 hypothetical protein [Thiobacillaceae bacterium]MDW8322811.1 hypothetical protein [Burkholderiales bacterium]